MSAQQITLVGFEANPLPLGLSQTPPADPWGINFGAGLNSTAMIIECRNRGYTPDWILFADTGSELPGTLDHVERMRQWAAGWCDIVTVRWTRQDELGAEPLHESCLRTGHLPSKAYGLAGCTDKWKIQPMDRWRKLHGVQSGAFAVGYDAGEAKRIKRACERGDMPGFTAWYPLIAWGIDRAGCKAICDAVGISVGKSSCFMCPNMKKHEWVALRNEQPKFFEIAVRIERNAAEHGNFGRGGNGLHWKGGLSNIDAAPGSADPPPDALEDRCHHGGCFT
jgi:hypothetical protein